MKTLPQMYVIILNKFRIDDCSNWICNTIKHTISLTTFEKLALLEHFNSQKPSEIQYQEFFNDSRFKEKTSEWWGRDERQVRISFLEKIIKNLEKDLVEPKV